MQKKLFSHIMTAAIPTTLATILPVTLSLASPMTVQAASGNDFRPEIVCPSGTEIQVEYLRHSMFKDREIDNYTIHCFRKFHQKGALSWHKGWTLTRATGYTTEDGIRRASHARGPGPPPGGGAGGGAGGGGGGAPARGGAVPGAPPARGPAAPNPPVRARR